MLETRALTSRVVFEWLYAGHNFINYVLQYHSKKIQTEALPPHRNCYDARFKLIFLLNQLLNVPLFWSLHSFIDRAHEPTSHHVTRDLRADWWRNGMSRVARVSLDGL